MSDEEKFEKPVKENILLHWFRRFVINIVTIGKIPNHVALIMDGNRRFGTKVGIKTEQAHEKGGLKLTECLQWCYEIGITQLTVYAFSIENFKRNKTEIEYLMAAFRKGIDKILEEIVKGYEKNVVSIRFIGNLSMMPKDIQKKMAQLMSRTKENKKYILNIAVAYTSRDEITTVIRKMTKGVENGDIAVSDISETLFNNCLFIRKSQYPDLLIRTSGETRFSDFLLWQTSTTVVFFTKVLWPEFSFWRFIGAILYYQLNYSSMKSTSEKLKITSNGPLNKRSQHYVQKLDNETEERL